MPNQELLPGVKTAGCPPHIACDAHTPIRKARRAAIAREVAQVALVVAVDFLFIHWPESRMPFLDRGHSVTFMSGINALVIADLWLARALPKWWAKKIATTWCRTERERFRS